MQEGRNCDNVKGTFLFNIFSVIPSPNNWFRMIKYPSYSTMIEYLLILTLKSLTFIMFLFQMPKNFTALVMRVEFLSKMICLNHIWFLYLYYYTTVNRFLLSSNDNYKFYRRRNENSSYTSDFYKVNSTTDIEPLVVLEIEERFEFTQSKDVLTVQWQCT